MEKHLISADLALRDAMRVIEAAPTKVALVVDNDGVLTRTVTDGDIRRGLLDGLDLNAPVRLLPGREPVTCQDGSPAAALATLFKAQDVRSVVVVDPAGRPLEIIDRDSGEAPILMSPPHLGQAELEYVHAAFSDNWIAPAGPNLESFEHQLKVVSQRSCALAVSSGTAALHLALRTLGIRDGDRVYVSDLTFVASLQPILYERATPVLIDSEPTSFNMSPQALARRLARDAADGCLPKAILLVHLYGQPAELNELCALADDYGIPVIEDAAESLGAEYGERSSGAHGRLAIYSFNGNKIITTSGGGALLSDDPALIDHARYLATQGRDRAEHYQHSEIAYNYRMSNVLAGIGLGQLQMLRSRVARRREIFARYRAALSVVPGIGFQQEVANSLGNRWLTVVTFDPNHISRHAYQFMRELGRDRIETRPGWKPMHMQPLCRDFDFEPHSLNEAVSPRLFFQSLCLPSGSAMTDGEQDRVIERILQLVRES